MRDLQGVKNKTKRAETKMREMWWVRLDCWGPWLDRDLDEVR